MALTTVLLFFTLSIVFSTHSLTLDGKTPSQPTDGTPFKCYIGNSDTPTCCSLVNNPNDGDKWYQPDGSTDDFRPTVPGHSKGGVGHHSFTCSYTQSLDDGVNEGQGCNCEESACTPDPNCSTSHAKKGDI